MSYLEIFSLIANIGSISTLIPIVYGIRVLKKQKLDTALKTVLGLLCISAVFSLITGVMRHFNMNNLMVGASYRVFAFVCISYFFWVLSNKKKVAIPIAVAAFGWLVFLMLNPFLKDDPNSYYGFVRAINGLIVMGLSVNYLYSIYDKEVDIDLKHSPQFVCVAGYMIYYGISFFVFLFSSYIFQNNNNLLFITFMFHAIGQIIMHLIFTYAFYLSSKKEEKPLNLPNGSLY